MKIILLFLRKLFLFEKHIENLVSERIVVDRYSDEKDHNNGKLGYHQCIVSLCAWKRISVEDDLGCIIVG